jgi:hypothetical protein
LFLFLHTHTCTHTFLTCSAQPEMPVQVLRSLNEGRPPWKTPNIPEDIDLIPNYCGLLKLSNEFYNSLTATFKVGDDKRMFYSKGERGGLCTRTQVTGALSASSHLVFKCHHQLSYRIFVSVGKNYYNIFTVYFEFIFLGFFFSFSIEWSQWWLILLCDMLFMSFEQWRSSSWLFYVYIVSSMASLVIWKCWLFSQTYKHFFW